MRRSTICAQEDKLNFDKQLFRTHLETADEASTPYDVFDALWKAFNVYYESLFQRNKRRELDRVHLAAQTLDKSDYEKFLTPKTVSALNGIPLVFSERDWHRRANKNTASHRVANSHKNCSELC